MEALFTKEGLLSLLTLTFLEVILGIDNIIFISIVCSKLPQRNRDKTRIIGLVLALLVRLGLLSIVTELTRLDKISLFSIVKFSFTIKDVILLIGGFFLIVKSIIEIHDKLEGKEIMLKKKKTNIARVILQIILIDIVFSFDSILTAVGFSRDFIIMALAVIMGMLTMLLCAKSIGDFIEEHPTVKILALSFLILIGFLLILESFDQHISKAYIYFTLFFSISIEFLNMKFRKKTIKQQLTDCSEKELLEKEE